MGQVSNANLLTFNMLVGYIGQQAAGAAKGRILLEECSLLIIGLAGILVLLTGLLCQGGIVFLCAILRAGRRKHLTVFQPAGILTCKICSVAELGSN